LVFQRGGALGAYPVGVYQALQEAGVVGNWSGDRRNQRQPDRGQPARRQARRNERLLEARLMADLSD